MLKKKSKSNLFSSVASKFSHKSNDNDNVKKSKGSDKKTVVSGKKSKSNEKSTKYLVDFENTSSNIYDTVEKAKAIDEILIFYTAKSERLSMELLVALKDTPAKVSLVRCENGTPNALDFQLSCYLGILLGKYGNSIEYVVVSDDNGYKKVRGLVHHQNAKISFVSKDHQTPRTNKTYGQTIEIF